MKSQTTMTLAAAVLLAGATFAVVPASAALFSSSALKASDSLTLSAQDDAVEKGLRLATNSDSAFPTR